MLNNKYIIDEYKFDLVLHHIFTQLFHANYQLRVYEYHKEKS